MHIEHLGRSIGKVSPSANAARSSKLRAFLFRLPTHDVGNRQLIQRGLQRRVFQAATGTMVKETLANDSQYV